MVAWVEHGVPDGHGGTVDRNHWGFLSSIATLGADNMPESYLVRILSKHKYHDERTMTMKAAEVEAANAVWREVYEAPPLAQNLIALIKDAARAGGDGGKRGLVQSFLNHIKMEGEQAELPITGLRLALVSSDTVPDGQGGTRPVRDTDGLISRSGEQFTLLVNDRVFAWVNEAAVVSTLFEHVCPLEKLQKEAVSE